MKNKLLYLDIDKFDFLFYQKFIDKALYFPFFDNFTTIEAFPSLKIYEVVEKGLHYHQAAALWTSHGLLPFLSIH